MPEKKNLALVFVAKKILVGRNDNFLGENEKNKLPDGEPYFFLKNLFLTVVKTYREVHTKPRQQLAEQFHL